MKELPILSFNYGHVEPDQIPARLEDLAAAGAHQILLEAKQLMSCADDPQYRKVLEDGLAANNLRINDVHAPHGMTDSLGCPLPGAEPQTVQVQLKAIRTAAGLGARTVTIHTARNRYVGQFAPETGPIEDIDLPGAKARIYRQLEVLLPEAEKCNIMLALENLFLPSSAASFIAPIVKEFAHPKLGLNYDSGHALLLERLPGKDPAQIAEWIRIGWPDNRVVLEGDQLDMMLDNVVTAHLHDNHGINDEHLMPGDGVANWKHIFERLQRAPRLVSLQSEVLSRHFGEHPGAQIAPFVKLGFSV